MKKKKLLSLALAVTMMFGSAAALPEGVFTESTSITAAANEKDSVLKSSDEELVGKIISQSDLETVFEIDEETASMIPEYNSVASDINAESNSFITSTGTKYGYNFLAKLDKGEKRQQFYNDVYDVAVKFWNQSIDCTSQTYTSNGKTFYIVQRIDCKQYGLTIEEAVTIYSVVKHDNPSFYFFPTTVAYSYRGELLPLVPMEYASLSTRKSLQDSIIAFAKKMSGMVKSNYNIYNKALTFNNYLCDNIEMAKTDGVPSNENYAHNIIGPIEYKKGVAEAFAKVYQLILNYIKLDNIYVIGKGNGGGHAWNMVKFDNGKYYYVDTTWNQNTHSNKFFANGSKSFAETHIAYTKDSKYLDFLYDLPTVPSDDYDFSNTYSIEDSIVELESDSFIYDGTAKKPSVTVKLGNKTLVKGTDYTVAYKNNVNVGTATIVVTGKGSYTGSVTKTFKIVAKTVSISSAVIHGPQSSYTYTGKAIAPAVKVVLNGKTLTKGTDYTVTYKNNVNVGTATIVVTGKGNYTGSVTKTFKIVAKSTSSFVWGKDNWNFNNSDYYPGYFSSGTYRSQINSTYLNKLKNNLTNSEYQAIFVGTWYSNAWLDDRWSGSCYGMSSTAFLAKKGLLPYSSYGSGATKLHDLTWPTKSSNISSLITYYQMLQVKDIIQQQYRTTPYNTNKENISRIISLLNNNSTVLVGFKKSGWGGHAILAYGYEYGSWTKSGVTYQGRIKICDPNSSIQNNENYYIYFNTNSYNWAIPGYSGISSSYGAVFNYIGANVNEINQGGYLSGKSSTRSSEYVARLDAMSVSNNRSVTKVRNTNGNYVNQNNAPGDIVEDYSYILGGKSKGTIGYNLYDADSAYKVTQNDPVNLQLSMKYQDCRLTGGSAAGKSVVFDKNGYVSVNGESAQFNISMTHDIDFPTDWFTVQVKGDNTNDASLKKVNNGWVVSADRLQNVEVAVNNKEDSAHVKFSTKYKSALIYEINKKTIGIAVDTDNNGTYETKVKTEDMTQTRLAGANRYETAAVISEDMYKNGTDTVIIATGLDFHDAMVAVPLASAYDAPLLLTTDKQVTKQTEAELKRLKAKKVIIVSTNGAVGSAVKAALAKYDPTVISGKNCFETASKVATALQKKTGKAPDTIFFATDSAFADALSASPVAAIKNAPIIYLKNKGSIDSATANYLKSVKGKVKNAYIIGGDGVISNAMMRNVATALGLKSGKTVVRVAGKNRYETCVAVNKKFKNVVSSDGICVAKGLDFPDALAGGVYAAKTKQALFLADGKKLQDVQGTYLKGKNASKITVFGGTGAVPDDLVKLIAKASV